jgi:hypothetical protein
MLISVDQNQIDQWACIGTILNIRITMLPGAKLSCISMPGSVVDIWTFSHCSLSLDHTVLETIDHGVQISANYDSCLNQG